MDDRRSHNADITGSHGNRMGGKYVFTGSTKHIDHLKKSVRMQKSRSIPVMTENDRILIGRKNSFIQSVSRMVSKAGGCMGRCLRAEFFYFLDGMCLVQMCSRSRKPSGFCGKTYGKTTYSAAYPWPHRSCNGSTGIHRE